MRSTTRTSRARARIGLFVALVALAACASPRAPAPTPGAGTTSPATQTAPWTTGSPVAPDTANLVERIRSGSLADAIAATQRLLAAAGVAVEPDLGGAPLEPVMAPRSTFVVSRATAEIMASEARAEIGVSGRILDDLTGARTSTDVLQWAASESTLSASAAALLLVAPGDDSAATVITPLVLALFLSDRAPRATAAVPAGFSLAVATVCDPYIEAFGDLLARQGIGGPSPQDFAAIALLLDVLPILEGGLDRSYLLDPPVNQWTVSGGPGRSGTVTLQVSPMVDPAIAVYAPCIDPIPPSGTVAWLFHGGGNAIVTSEDDSLTLGTPASAVLTYAMSREAEGATQEATGQMAVAGGYEHYKLSQLDAVIKPILGRAPSAATALLATMIGRLELDIGAGPLLGMVPILIPVSYHVCGASDACASTAPSATAASIAGTWHGTWTSAVYDGLAGGFTLEFVTKGSSLSGTISIGGTPCLSAGTISGTLAGRSITFGAVQGAEVVEYTGTWTGSAMGGDWGVSAPSGGVCTLDHGTWQATR